MSNPRQGNPMSYRPLPVGVIGTSAMNGTAPVLPRPRGSRSRGSEGSIFSVLRRFDYRKKKVCRTLEVR